MATLPTFRFSSDYRRLYAAGAIALVAELAVFGGVWALLIRAPAAPPAPPAQPVTITLAAPVQPAPQAAPRPAPQPVPPPRPAPSHPAAPTHRVVRAAPPPRAATPPPPTPTLPAHMAPAPGAPAPSAASIEAPPSAAPAAAPAATAAPAGPTPSFEGALRAAIQAALRYPEAARMAGMAGRTRVAFHYRDGVVSDATVIISSGMGMLDRAALAAVHDANCPKPEPAFAGKTLSEQLWVNFNLNDHE